MAIFRSETDINSHLAELYELQGDQIHIHFVQLGHQCERKCFSTIKGFLH